MDRFYIAVRRDLTSGQQAAQVTHAALAFHHEHPSIAKEWFTSSNYLVIVNTPDEDGLRRLIQMSSAHDIVCTPMHEPDLNDTMTAVALQPGTVARKICANLPLALREKS